MDRRHGLGGLRTLREEPLTPAAPVPASPCACRPQNALLTGSRVYGTPHEKSDVDLVILMDPNDASCLGSIMGAEKGEPDDCYPTIQFKAGMLNVIVETNPEKLSAWKKGTAMLAERAPVTREDAVELFKKLFGEVKDEQR